MSRVDVVIPCYKYAHYLRECVESVLSQKGVDVRVLILDDASPDDTPEVAAELVREDSRVEYRRHAVNKGHIETYNEGLLEWASSEYSLLLSADDLLTPGALERAVRLMNEHPNVGLTYGLAFVFEGDRVPEDELKPDKDYQYQIITGSLFLERACGTRCNEVPTPTAVVRTSLQHQIGGYRKSLPHTCDLEMWLRFAVRGHVGVLAVHQAFQRFHSENMNYQYRHPALGDMKEHRDAFDSLFREYVTVIPEGLRLRGIVARGFAEDAFWRASRAFEQGNVSAILECLKVARSTWPPITTTPYWSRFRLKRLIGPKVWSMLKPLVQRRRRAAPQEHQPKSGEKRRTIGWWPEGNVVCTCVNSVEILDPPQSGRNK